MPIRPSTTQDLRWEFRGPGPQCGPWFLPSRFCRLQITGDLAGGRLVCIAGHHRYGSVLADSELGGSNRDCALIGQWPIARLDMVSANGRPTTHREFAPRSIQPVRVELWGTGQAELFFELAEIHAAELETSGRSASTGRGGPAARRRRQRR